MKYSLRKAGKPTVAALCGLAAVIGLQPIALAAGHKHRHVEVAQRRPHHASHQEAVEPGHRRHADKTASAHRRRLQDQAANERGGLELKSQDSRRRQVAAVLTPHQKRMALKEHLHRLYLAENKAKRLRALIKEAYLAHLARIEQNRRERLAELNGNVASKSIRAWQAYVASVPIRLISVDLNDPSVRVSALLARDGIGSAEPFSRMIRRSQPDVAVTGTFFSLDNLRPVGDIVINGGLAYFGGMGTALCITRDNRAAMVTVPWGHHHDWSEYDFVMACGPRLLEDGMIVLDPAAERFHDKQMLAPNSRIGVGITSTNKLVFVMTQKPIYLGRLAKIMRVEGCKQAMNLDAGTSTGFYCEGNMMARPGRWLTNAIVIYARQHQAQRASLFGRLDRAAHGKPLASI